MSNVGESYYSSYPPASGSNPIWAQNVRIIGGTGSLATTPITVRLSDGDRFLQSTGSLDPGLRINIGRGSNTDAFGRLRVSNPSSIFDSKNLNSINPFIFVSASVGAASSITKDNNISAAVLQTDSNLGDYVTYQSRRTFNYQPGKSMMIATTFNFSGSHAGASKQIGYYNANDGIFFTLSGSGDVGLVLRDNTSGTPSDLFVSQSAWNIDRFDGSGDLTTNPSKILLDTSKAQIFWVDFQWLGVGALRAGFDIDGILYYAHDFTHANKRENVYIVSPNLPIRSEIINDTVVVGNPKMAVICSSVQVEGGQDKLGIENSIDFGTTSKQIPVAYTPLIGIRLKSGHTFKTVIPRNFNILASTNQPFAWRVAINPVIGGGVETATWIDIGNSAVEYTINQTGSMSGGLVIDSGYQSEEVKSLAGNISEVAILGSEVDGTSDILYIAAAKIGTGTDNMYAALKWLELF